MGYSPWGRKESQLTQQQQIIFTYVLKDRKDHVGLKVSMLWGLFAGPVINTPCFHSRGRRFDPWSRNQISACCMAQPKKKKYLCC